MSCRTPTRKEKELIGVEDYQNDNNPQVMASCLDKVAALKKKKHDQQRKMGFHHHQLTDDSRSQTLSMFRKYLCSKTQNSIVGKTIMEESEVIKKKHAATGRPLPPPKSGGHMPRQASLLEQKLLPGIRNEGMQSEYDGKSSAAQLTIFYAGAINVYDNVPADKAQAIMLLAGESSMSKPVAVELPRIETKKSPLHCSNLTSVCKLQPDLPIARKRSLQHFLEKRRRRIISKSPYSTPRAEHNKETKPRADDDGSNGDHSISLSPFPSRLGYFFPISANKGH